jgi:hypothetical protein
VLDGLRPADWLLVLLCSAPIFWFFLVVLGRRR